MFPGLHITLFAGSQMVLNFEVKDFDDLGNRIYDIVFETNTGKTVRAELKNWGSFTADNIKTLKGQFVKDLNKMTELGELKWIFNKTSGITDSKVLKENILNTLKKADGSPVDELANLFDDTSGKFANKMSNLFDTEIRTAKDLLTELSESDNFNRIFEIVE